MSLYNGIETNLNFLLVQQIKILNICNVSRSLQRLTNITNTSGALRNLIVVKALIGIFMGTEQTQDRLFIFLEYISGGSIADMLEKFGALHESIVKRYTHDLLCGLDFLHARSIAHCDIKGANLLVSEDGVVKLADFNSSKLLVDIPRSGTQRDLRSIAGTPQVLHTCLHTLTQNHMT